jgi:Domain of unknown function (DUF4283)
VKANSLPVIKFYTNPANKKFRDTIRYSLVFHDKLDLGPIYVQTYLQQQLPFSGWTWVARTLPTKKLLVEPPTDEWRSMLLSKGEIGLGSVNFIVESYDFKKFDGGTNSILVWINITGLPPHLWKEDKFRRLALELGGLYLKANTRS